MKPSVVAALAGVLALAGCTPGPRYQRPAAVVPPAFKEQPPADFKEAQDWKQAQPNDGQLKGKWWEIYNDADLNALEERVAIDNQSVLQAEAQYREAVAAVKIVRSGLYPSVSTAPSITESRNSPNTGALPGVRSSFSLPISASWEPDLWGNIRRSITAAAAQAQVSAADLENARLLYQSELAQDYFALHGLDGDIDLLTRTVKSYAEYLDLTHNRFRGGIASDLDVAQAEAQLYAAQTELVDFGVTRAQMEHAIAVLAGQPPSAVSVSAKSLTSPPPAVPIALPSALLERRPDIAANERLAAAANEQIGIAQAAFFPALTLAATAGLQASRITTWISWPSRFFSVGPTLAETIFDAGRRRAQVTQNLAAYDAAVAAYRQSVLTAFQQVEDSLSTLRILADESVVADESVKSAGRALAVSTAQYKAGTTAYLTVLTAQGTALAAERTQIDLLTRRLEASVQLVVNLGGGWDNSQLPTKQDVVKTANPPQPAMFPAKTQ
ncbi:MAG: efflux transporter outer membrane subunit [Bryobacteraceae bacterium]|jgi:NodT family efflux transporter outer membrane factor (OMF) lipoprotein